MDSLKAEFDQSWDANAKYSYETGDDSDGLLWELRSPQEIALDMLTTESYYWQHYGWAHSLHLAVFPGVIGKEQCQQLCQKILAVAPPGLTTVYPEIETWASGNFEVHERIEAFVNETQPEWLEQLRQNREARSQQQTEVA